MRTAKRVVLATRNRGKLREFRSLLSPEGWEILGLDDLSAVPDVEESGVSFSENARMKALAYSRYTDLPVLADDSGLEVVGLGGRPGIFSARYAGATATDSDRIHRLLEELDQAGGERTARFFCALALAQRGRLVAEAEGECIGVIARDPRGGHGFGYDPVFLIPDLGKTFAELSEQEKNRQSHRARAVRALLEALLGEASSSPAAN